MKIWGHLCNQFTTISLISQSFHIQITGRSYELCFPNRTEIQNSHPSLLPLLLSSHFFFFFCPWLPAIYPLHISQITLSTTNTKSDSITHHTKTFEYPLILGTVKSKFFTPVYTADKSGLLSPLRDPQHHPSHVCLVLVFMPFLKEAKVLL